MTASHLEHIEASPRKKMICPDCQAPMTYHGDGRYTCPNGCGEWLRSDQEQEQPAQAKTCKEARPQMPWPELVEGMPAHLRQGMIDIATLPLQTYAPGPCQGHGGKGTGGKSGRGKSPARQKAEAWQRKVAPGRFIRSIKVG